MAIILEPEEYIEQAYFFRHFRERMDQNLPAQESLEQVYEEILTTTRLPMAVQFLATEIKHTGLLSSGFWRLPHYFTAFQAFVIQCAEEDKLRFTLQSALLILEREADYRARNVTVQGLFVYQFVTLCRHRLGYDGGIKAMAQDPYYNEDWRTFLEVVRYQVGLIDLSDFIYLRSDLYVKEQQRHDADYVPPLPPLFGEKEGKIARANRSRDPLYFFAALQRQLNYPEVPRPQVREDPATRVETLLVKIRELEARLKLVEGELRGQVDLSKLGKPDLFQDDEELG
jgi:hypothetical protein